MTYDYARVDAHQNGDCDCVTCPLCELDRLDEEVECTECGEMTADPELCTHDRVMCEECAEANRCRACMVEGKP